MMEEALKTKYAYSFDFSREKGPAPSTKDPDRIFADRTPDPRIFDVQKLEIYSGAPHRPGRCTLKRGLPDASEGGLSARRVLLL